MHQIGQDAVEGGPACPMPGRVAVVAWDLEVRQLPPLLGLGAAAPYVQQLSKPPMIDDNVVDVMERCYSDE